MDKINIGTNVFILPMPVTLVGTTVEGQANFMPVGWVSRVNGKPPIVAVGLNKRHYTPLGIQEHQTFSVNFPNVGLVERADYCGLVSGRKTDKSDVFEVFYGQLETAPMIAECPLCLECTLFNTVLLPTHFLFLGEIVAAYSEERYLTDGQPDVGKMKPFVLTMPDNNYWTVGGHLAKAWNVGRDLEFGEE